MKNLIFNLSYNYLIKTHKLQNISKMIRVCFCSIFLATFFLTLSLFIMSGFEKTTKEKLKNINPDIILESYGQNLNFEKIAPILKDEFQQIKEFSPTENIYGILEKNNEIFLNRILMIKGIVPNLEKNITSLEKLIIIPNEPLEYLLTENSVLIGKKFSILENLNIGDKFNIVFAKNTSKKRQKINFESQEVIVSGIFETGIDELDNNLIISCLNLIQTKFENKNISQINIKLKTESDEKDFIRKIKKRFGIQAYSWQDLNPAIVSALKLEKYLTFIILSLLVLIASMNLISLIYMLITRKRKEIAILFTLGLSIKKIKLFFLLITTTISLTATLSGISLAILLAKILSLYKIPIPDAYFVSYLPIEIKLVVVPIILITSLALTIVSTIAPIKSIENLNISEILRFD
jgi:lipoprotein-releasing system permease protein